ncbi:hypothetical protein [Pseudomonas indica]|uniref:Uncharacterized protein n=1 Tax=Pseudomonas indica TaxID=137658 RepID=A0A1G9KCD6_9PSED|nr:hypothetical protein [Pseudomonas indica]MBU3057633.1 hypothetical protein [Pseudomonas indica]SDL47488.1 hypothetical protein SAMN05216186_12210 [Pseudomonas indica]
MFGQINPMNFIVAHRLATNQNVDSKTATRHALVGSLLGEGILGPVIARQLAIRDAAAIPPATRPATGAPAGSTANPLENISQTLRTWTEAESQRDAEDLKRANELIAQANERRHQRTEALRALCESLGTLSTGSTCPATGTSEEPKDTASAA